VLYSINYDIQDIDSYFLLAYVTLALWVAAGLAAIGRWCLATLQLHPAAVAAAMLLVGGVPLLSHYAKVDESKNYLVEDYTINMFSSLQPDALVLSYQWDYWVSAACYYQLIRRYRPDVAVVDKELLRRSWYYPQLAARHPWLIGGSSAEVESFLAELAKFEHERPYDPAVIQGKFVAMIRSFIARSLPVRPVYVTGEIEEDFTRGLQRVPEGLAFRLYADSLFHPTPEPQFAYRPFPRPGRLEDLTRAMYAQSLAARGAYYLANGRRAEAERSLNSAISFDPGFSEARRLLSLLRK
jgi:tetratricopeptide (TPR) repeat protein